MHRTTPRVLALLAVAALFAGAALAADQPRIPLDGDGLPAWQAKEWTDFPVRLELDDHEALQTLLRTVPIASFHREQLRPEFTGPKTLHLVLETRVTEAEFDALVRAGYQPERLRDVHRENREASEKLWADMYAGKAVDVRTDPLNYVPTNDQLGTMLQGIAATIPNLAHYYSWGQSIQGRTLHAS